MNSAVEDISTIAKGHLPPPPLKTIELQVVAGPDAGVRKTFHQPAVKVGTARGNDLVLTDRRVSRHHLELRMTLQGPVLRDLWSTNGTFINFRPVTETHLGPETLCELGDSRLAMYYTAEPTAQSQLGALVGASPPMQELYSLIRLAAPTQATVLLYGESGSGKEVVARTLHEISSRRTGPRIVCDVSAKSPQIIHDDFFGHVKGSFSGADRPRKGAFREAHLGTLMIDEIGELPLESQPLLLRALEAREVTPLGADRPEPVDVRVVAATHRDLWAMVQQGRFRADLFYRLWVFPINVPPLRDIREDIPLLAQHLLKNISLPCRISPEALERLQGHHWAGNVRELRNVLERAAVLCPRGEILPEHLEMLPPPSPRSETPIPVNVPPHPTLEEVERKMILEAWERNGHSVQKTARELEISLATLKRRLKAFKEENLLPS
ncbi:MAG: sigma 54-interacting transcriptional regulator [Gammaproteobacteria bacterium]